MGSFGSFHHYSCLSPAPLFSSSTRKIATTAKPSFSFSSSSKRRNLSSLVRWEPDEHKKIGILTLQSPETYNSLTEEMGREFQEVVRTINKELTTNNGSAASTINAIVITSDGEDAFSAGGNFDWLRSLGNNSIEENTEKMLSFYKSFLCIRTLLPVPVIAAVQGPAIGAGACLALACDMRIGRTDHPRLLGFPFTRLGIHSGMGGSHLLRQTINCRSRMTEVLLRGKVLSSSEAHRLGLLNTVSNDPKETARELAQEFGTETNPFAVRLMVQTLRQNQDVGLEKALRKEAMAQALCYNRNDWGEGLDSILEKRTPNFDDYFEKPNRDTKG